MQVILHCSLMYLFGEMRSRWHIHLCYHQHSYVGLCHQGLYVFLLEWIELHVSLSAHSPTTKANVSATCDPKINNKISKQQYKMHSEHYKYSRLTVSFPVWFLLDPAILDTTRNESKI